MSKEKRIRICFVGGDKRQAYAAEKMSEIYEVNVVGEGFDSRHKYHRLDSVLKACYDSKIIVLPLPANKSEKTVDFDSLVQIAKDNEAVVIGGMFAEYMKIILDNERIKYIDYYDDEIFTLTNAYLTAEGAVNCAMNSFDGCLRRSGIAIVGYGRIGAALGELLSGLGCKDVTVFARRGEVLTLAKERGLTVKRISEKESFNFDIVFNTVPARIISNEQLLSMRLGTIIVELASAPGGFDREIAEQSGLTVINASGIPGKYAPASAGEAVAEVIQRIIDKEVFL